MKRATHLLIACLATAALSGAHQEAIAAEGEVAAQDLAQVRASGQVVAVWSRQPDSYTLQVVLEQSRPRMKMKMRPRSLADDMYLKERNQQFISNTITTLRGREFPCERFPARFNVAGEKERRAEVRLEAADGTEILPTAYSCIADDFSAEKTTCDVTISYRYPLASGAQAVAAAIWIDDEHFVEKLQSLELSPSPSPSKAQQQHKRNCREPPLPSPPADRGMGSLAAHRSTDQRD